MTKINQDPKRRCPAMIEAGIYDPESQKGIDFCVGHCPYDKCIVYEVGRASSTEERNKRVAKAKEMAEAGYYPKIIALRLGVTAQTVRNYLRK